MDTTKPGLTLRPKQTLTEEVTEQLRNAIFRGHFEPGERLSEEQLARSLGISRGPIREAFVRLEGEGLITSQANRRTVVTRLSRRDLEEVYTIRLALERLAVQYALHYAQPADFAAMAANSHALEQAIARGITEQEAATLDVEFHDLLYRASHHQHAIDAWSNIRSKVYLFLLSRNLANADFRERGILQGHNEIVQALANHDEQQAVRCIEAHLRGAYNYIVENYPAGEDESEAARPLGGLALEQDGGRAE